MPPKNDNVKRLLLAEERRNKIVADAKVKKQQKVRQARADAEKDVSAFKLEREKEFAEFKEAQLGGAEVESSKFVQETDRQIHELRAVSSARLDKVSSMMVELVCNVNLN